jgi:hypothetical protein
LREGQVATTKTGIVEAFGSLGRARIAIEVGTHSPWVSRLLLNRKNEIEDDRRANDLRQQGDGIKCDGQTSPARDRRSVVG